MNKTGKPAKIVNSLQGANALMIHDHVVTRRRHPGYGPVEAQDP
jgi:hypothetical protein